MRKYRHSSKSQTTRVEEEFTISNTSNVLLLRVVELLGPLWALAILGMFIASYKGISVTDALSFRVDDSWCQLEMNEGVGTHCFGDFGMPYYMGGFEHEYVPGNNAASMTPLLAWIFLGFRQLPYNMSLVIYLSTLIVPLYLVIRKAIASAVGGLWPSPVMAHLLTGLGTLGVIASMDRGNHVIWFIPILYYLVKKMQSGDLLFVSLLIFLGSLLKWWGPILVLLLLIDRRYRLTILTLAWTTFAHLALLLAFPHADFFTRLKSSLQVVFDSDYAAVVAPYSVSFTSAFNRIACLVTDGAECVSVAPDDAVFFGEAISVLIPLITIAAVFVIGRRMGSLHPITVTFYCSLIFLAVPAAAPYNLVGASAASLILLGNQRAEFAESTTAVELRSQRWLPVALAVSLVPIPLFYFTESSIGVPFDRSFLGMFRLSAVVVPVSWFFALLAALRDARHFHPDAATGFAPGVL